MFALASDLASPAFRARMLEERFNRFDFTLGGHTLAAYRRLPRGWETTPPEIEWTDLHMWRKFLREPWCRAATAMVPAGICTQTHKRPGMSNAERAAELAAFAEQTHQPGFREGLWRLAARQFTADLAVRLGDERGIGEAPPPRRFWPGSPAAMIRRKWSRSSSRR